jgi:hypothetical protein
MTVFAGTLATGALDLYGYLHDVIVLLCTPAAIITRGCSETSVLGQAPSVILFDTPPVNIIERHWFAFSKKMFQENSRADGDQDYASGDLRPFLKNNPDALAYQKARKTHGKSDGADECRSLENVLSDEAEGDTSRKSVNAGGNCKQRQCFEVAYVCSLGLVLTLAAGQSLKNHLAADKGKQYNRNPMIKSLYIGNKGVAQKPAGNRHEKLEQAEKKGSPDCVSLAQIPYGDAGAYRNGKSIQ